MQEPVMKIKYFPLLIGVILAIGVFLGMNLDSPDFKRGVFNSGFSEKNKLMDIINLIDREYVDSVDKANLLDKGIEALLENLDPHSVYIPPIELQYIEEEMSGNFEGIGVQYRIIRDTVVVIKPIKGGPSAKAGLLAGDRIVIADKDTLVGASISNDEVMHVLKGEKGSKVVVQIKRMKSPELLSFSIVRGRIPTYSMDVAYLADKNIGFIKLRKFTATTYREFIEGAHNLQEKGMKSLILDLRDNPGGYLKAATSIVNEFLEKDNMILFTDGKNRDRTVTKASGKGSLKNIEVYVLLNENSASASEIVAGALQDNDRAMIIGRRSYGKGLVSTQFPFPDGSGLRLTIARYYTPTGRCIQKPYEKGRQEYAHDFIDRYKSGELLNKDSMRLEHLPQYTTPKGKIVYGGGGIIPDVFVPIDTSISSKYYNDLLRNNILFDYAFEYVDRNRKYFTQFENSSEFSSQFNVSEHVLKELITYAKEKGIVGSNKDLQLSKEDVKWHLKALISRELYDFEGFYPIWHIKDPVFQKAMEMSKDH